MQNDPEWFEQAKCAGKDPRIFLLPNNYNVKKIKGAKSICKGCPVKDPCFWWACASDSVGIAGGMTREERERSLLLANLTGNTLSGYPDTELLGTDFPTESQQYEEYIRLHPRLNQAS